MANTPIDSMTATFGVGDQTAIKMDVTDSGPSNALSKLIDLRVGGSSKFKVTKEGYVTATNYTGSVSGSVFIKGSGFSGTKYLIFADGSGRRTLGTDTGGLTYDPGAQTFTAPGNITYGGDLDTTNVSTFALPSPTTIYFGSAATTLVLGNTSAGSITNIATKRTTGTTFEGKLTGSHSGSILVKNEPSSANYFDLVFVGGPGQQGLKVDTGMMFYDPANNSLTVDTDVYAGNGFDVLVNTGPTLFSTPTTITFAAGATTLNIGNSGASSHTKFLSKQVRGHFTGSFTGSFSGSRANFNKLSGSNAKIAGRVIATSYTGSISGSLGKFTNLFADNITIDQSLIGNSFTGSLSGSVYVNLNSSNNDLYVIFTPKSIGQSPLYTDGDLYYNPGTSILTVQGSVLVDDSVDTTSVSEASLFNSAPTLIIGESSNLIKVGKTSATRIELGNFGTRVVVSGSISGSLTRFRFVSGSRANFGRVNSSFTGSIRGTRGFFTQLTSSTARFTIRVNSPEFTGSISGSKAFFNKLTGSNSFFTNRVTAVRFTGSISGSRGSIGYLSSSYIRVKRNVIATSFTGSFSGSKGWIGSLTASKLRTTNLIADQLTSSIFSPNAKFTNVVVTQRISSSLFSGSRGVFTQLTSSKAKITALQVTNITSSLSGSVYVNLNNSNNDLYVIFTPTSVGQSPLYTDGDLYYNPGQSLLTVQGNILIDDSIDSTSFTTSSLFNSVPTVNIGLNSNIVRVGKVAPYIAFGGFNTQIILSGSITGSRARFTRLSASRARIERLSGSHANYTTGSFKLGRINQLTCSFGKITNITASTTYTTVLTSSNALVENDLNVTDDLTVSGSFNFRYPLTGSGPSSHRLFMSGAGAIQGYMGIKINGVKYKIPLYAW